jgi:hypothetical protein
MSSELKDDEQTLLLLASPLKHIDTDNQRRIEISGTLIEPFGRSSGLKSDIDAGLTCHAIQRIPIIGNAVGKLHEGWRDVPNRGSRQEIVLFIECEI